jgi:hypothetical protein
VTILDALRDRRLFGALSAFRDLASWNAWRAFLAAVYGLPCQRPTSRHYLRPLVIVGY